MWQTPSTHPHAPHAFNVDDDCTADFGAGAAASGANMLTMMMISARLCQEHPGKPSGQPCVAEFGFRAARFVGLTNQGCAADTQHSSTHI